MKHTLRTDIILSSFILIFIQRGYAPETPEMNNNTARKVFWMNVIMAAPETPERKSCENWILDKTKLPFFLPVNGVQNKYIALNYYEKKNYNVVEYLIKTFNFWKSAYLRYNWFKDADHLFQYPTYISPAEFCELVGGDYTSSCELIEEETTVYPCHKWILISGYYIDNVEKNIDIAKERVENQLNNFLSGFAVWYGKHLLEEDGEKLDPISYCKGKLDLKDDDPIINVMEMKTLTVPWTST